MAASVDGHLATLPASLPRMPPISLSGPNHHGSRSQHNSESKEWALASDGLPEGLRHTCSAIDAATRSALRHTDDAVEPASLCATRRPILHLRTREIRGLIRFGEIVVVLSSASTCTRNSSKRSLNPKIW